MDQYRVMILYAVHGRKIRGGCVSHPEEGIPSVLIQVLFSLPICLLQGGVAKSYEGLKTPFAMWPKH